MGRFFTISLLIILPLIATAQQSSRSVLTDFPISSDSTRSTFHQYDIRLFPKPDSGFVAAWIDERDGEPAYYAQNFDASGNRVGYNFKTTSSDNILFLKNGSSLSLTQSYSGDIFFGEWLGVDGYFYDPQGNQITSSPIAAVQLPWCGTGYLGTDFQASASNDHYYFLMRDDGVMYLSRLDAVGNASISSLDFLGDHHAYRHAGTSTIAALPNGDYFIAWYDLYYDTTDRIYGKFFSKNDSTYRDEDPLGLYPSTNGINSYAYQVPKLKAICLQDSMYELFAMQSDSGRILFRTFDRHGTPLSARQQISLPFTETNEFWLAEFSISTIANGSFDVIVKTVYDQSSNLTYYTSKLTFDLNGLPIGQPIFDTLQFPEFGSQFIKLNDSLDLIGAQGNNDVYLTRIHNLTFLDSVKVNDDLFGNNERASHVTTVPGNRFFVTWADNQKIAGQLVNDQGEIIGTPQTLRSQDIRFLRDNIVNLWTEKTDSEEAKVGFTLYNYNWEVVNVETLSTIISYDEYIRSTCLEKLTDTTFVVTYPDNVYSNVAISLFSEHQGELINKKHFQPFNGFTDSKIFINDNTSFWVQNGEYVRKYSNSLEPLSDSARLAVQLHLENDSFLSVATDNTPREFMGTVKTLQGSVTGAPFVVARNCDSLSVYQLTTARFLALIRTGNTIYAKTFFNDGRIDHDSVVISSSASWYRRDASCAIKDGKAFFSWSETSPSSRGYDIVGSIMDISSLMGINDSTSNVLPQEFSLDQNYPNPFNPVTTIRYALKAKGHVTLKIYNVLGEEVATLFNGMQEAGLKSQTWDAGNFPSGVYYYRLMTDGYSETKKLLYIK